MLHEDGAVAAVVSPLFSVSSGGFLLLPMADLVAAVVWPAGWRRADLRLAEGRSVLWALLLLTEGELVRYWRKGW